MYIVSLYTNTPFGSFLSAIHIAMLQLSRPELQDSEEFGAALVCSHPCSPSSPQQSTTTTLFLFQPLSAETKVIVSNWAFLTPPKQLHLVFQTVPWDDLFTIFFT